MLFQKRFSFILGVSLVLLFLCGGQVAQAGATGKLEVFSWWTSGGEAAALDALFTAYKGDNPDVEIVNATVAGGGGSAARGVLQTRLAGGDPPDRAYGGAERGNACGGEIGFGRRGEHRLRKDEIEKGAQAVARPRSDAADGGRDGDSRGRPARGRYRYRGIQTP